MMQLVIKFALGVKFDVGNNIGLNTVFVRYNRSGY